MENQTNLNHQAQKVESHDSFDDSLKEFRHISLSVDKSIEEIKAAQTGQRVVFPTEVPPTLMTQLLNLNGRA